MLGFIVCMSGNQHFYSMLWMCDLMQAVCKLTSSTLLKPLETGRVTWDRWWRGLGPCNNHIWMFLEWRLRCKFQLISMSGVVFWNAVSELMWLMKARCGPAQCKHVRLRNGELQDCCCKGWSVILHKMLFMALVAQELVTSKPHTLVLLYVITRGANLFFSLCLNKLNVNLFSFFLPLLAHITLCNKHFWTQIK